uniref:EamA domain-containing protein n=1 Tax=Eucampia antarctica TaxID=49252 RepID=A0A6U0QYS8_9STRA|mmetsp:Transcript_17962/g.17314  ORF Transcript_17962/g.17314 Transcript_17962/m.17314 type:complete len:401 (+) Transcript_17962:120-1322(+)
MFEECSNSCGLIAAFISALCIGSFGVPLKSDACIKMNADPLIMQTYKTFMLFSTSWLVLLFGVPLQFTPFGILSGLFWILGGTAGIYAIRNAGLAVAIGTWAPTSVITSFFWGIFIFEEKIKSPTQVCVAILLLMTGLIGMGRYSKKFNIDDDLTRDDNSEKDEYNAHVCEAEEQTGHFKNPSKRGPGIVSEEEKPFLHNSSTVKNITEKVNNKLDKDRANIGGKCKTNFVYRLYSRLSRRDLGILAAVFNGCWGGTTMIPMHYARSHGIWGPGYLISFACGSMFVLIMLWMVRFGHHLYQTNYDLAASYQALPSFHFRELSVSGIFSGLLLCIGLFSSMIAILSLGQAIGNSLVNAKVIISGLWGIFFYKEITGKEFISKWLLSAAIAVFGILLLVYQK